MKKWILPAGALLVLGTIVTVSLLGSRPRGAPVETGRVERGEIRSVVTATGAYFPVQVRITGTGEGLRPGMTARVRIQAESRKGVLVVAIQAIVEKKDTEGKSGSSSNPEGQKIVYRVEGGKARAAPVGVGLNDETRAEILSGVREGEKIAVGPYRTLKNLRDGAAVTESATKK